MMNLLPYYEQESKIIQDLYSSITPELYGIDNNLACMQNDLFVGSVVERINRWEKALNITENNSKSIEFRREKILSKIRGTGTTTKTMIKEAAASYSNGEVEVIEDNTNYRFIVKFTGVFGIPANMADLTIIIDEIKPAHLNYTFEYSYRTHKMLAAYTHNQLSAFTHQQLREGVI